MDALLMPDFTEILANTKVLVIIYIKRDIIWNFVIGNVLKSMKSILLNTYTKHKNWLMCNETFTIKLHNI